MSKERELLKKILATGWLNNTISCEVEELLAQPEFKPDWANYRQGVADSKREPLSSIKILELTSKHEYAINLIRAVEKAHGITGGWE
tara:strand:- start:1697 stop:1957 length:261 start_codon:yes stop_codon:yes gene_type:complete